MLEITVTIEPEKYDDENEEFIPPVTKTLTLEHSLVSISKWESKWCKAFLSKREKTTEETIDYIKCMTLTRDVDPKVFDSLSDANISSIDQYITAPMTATYLPDTSDDKKQSKETVTSELIYYWMIALNIPFECKDWHLNRLLALIDVCNAKNAPPDKKGRKPNLDKRRALNEARKAKHNSKG